MSAQARADGRAIREASVPETIEDAVLERLGRRSREAQAVARAGAVIGRCFVARRPGRHHGRPTRGARRADPGAHRPRRPRSRQAPGLVDFRHQLLRDAIYRSVTLQRPPALPRAGRRVRRAARGPVGDPRVRPLRAGGPAPAGIRGGPRRRAQRRQPVGPSRGVRALSARRRQHARRPVRRRAAVAVRDVRRSRPRRSRRTRSPSGCTRPPSTRTDGSTIRPAPRWLTSGDLDRLAPRRAARSTSVAPSSTRRSPRSAAAPEQDLRRGARSWLLVDLAHRPARHASSSTEARATITEYADYCREIGDVECR